MSARVRAVVAWAVMCLGMASSAAAQPQPYQTGDLFISTTGGAVYGYRFVPEEGTWVPSLVLLTETPDSPNTGSAFDRNGNFYVATFVAGTLGNPVNGKVIKFSRDWDPESGTGTIPTFGFAPKSIVFDAAGNMFVGHARKNPPPAPCAPPPPGVTLRGDVLTKVGPDGACLGAFTVEVEGLAQAGDGGAAKEGVDWIDLASDQRTIYYTSQGRRIMRYDTAAQTQLPDFALLPDDPVCSEPHPPVCGQAFALRLLSDGGLLVADRLDVKRLDASGNIVMVYDRPSQDEWFSLNLDPDGTSFWSGDSFNAHLFKFDIASGAMLVEFDTQLGVRRLFLGVSVFNEPTQGVKEIGDIKGVVYVDANHNRMRDAGEPGIGGVTVTLAGASAATATTAADGTYAFIGVPAGHYSVSSPAAASGWQLFTASPLDLDLAAGDVKSDRDFGYVTGSISGVAYVDVNRNGSRDLGEPGLDHVLITLGGGASASVFTGADGRYTFNMIASGSYTTSAPAAASGKALATPSPLDVVVALGEDRTGVDFGYVPGGITGVVYVDANRNSARDAGEAGISGVSVTLTGGPGGTATTDASGAYSFSDLDEGAFSVTAPATASGKALGTSSPLTAAVIAGQTTPNVNFGYVTGAISGVVYVDANRNSVRDAGEAGISGVVVTLTGGPGGTATTDGSGAYTFSGLDAGSFSVAAPATATGKALATTTPLTPAVEAGQTTGNQNFGYVTGGISGAVYVDANRNGVRDAGEAGIGDVVVTLTGGGTATTDGTGAYTFSGLDAGAYSVTSPATAGGKAIATTNPRPATVTAGETTPDVNFGYVTGGISGIVYADANRNGVRDAGEAGIGGVVVTLTGGPGGTATTDVNGAYSFTDLDAASYSVSAPSAAGGLALGTPSPVSAAVAAGQVTPNVNFGYVSPVGGLSGVVYLDRNENGVRDAGEPGIGGVVVVLANGVTTTSAADGSYSFIDLTGGLYVVGAPATAAGNDLGTTSPLPATVTAGQTTPDVNFGYVESEPDDDKDCRNPKHDHPKDRDDSDHHPGDRDCRDRRHNHPKDDDCPRPKPQHHPGDGDCQDRSHNHPKDDDCPRPKPQHHPGDGDCRDRSHNHPKDDDCPRPKPQHHPGDGDCRDRRHNHPKDDDCPRPKPQHHPGDGDCRDRKHNHPKDDDCRTPARSGNQRSTTK